MDQFVTSERIPFSYFPPPKEADDMATTVNAFKPVEAQLVLSLDDLIKERQKAFKQEKSKKKGDAAKTAKKTNDKAKKTQALNKKRGIENNTPAVAPKKKKKAKVAKTTTTTQNGEADGTTKTVRRKRNKKKNNQTAGNAAQTQPNPSKKKQPASNNQQTPKKQNTQPQQPKKQVNKKAVQVNVQRGKAGARALQNTISPSNNKKKQVVVKPANKDERKVLFNVTMKGLKNMTLKQKKRAKKASTGDHPVKRLLGNHLPSGEKKAGALAAKPKMAFKRRNNKKVT
ncbi:unnamed protein product [Aphanomyces euteiches]|uniref:Uncharacterized protein n=1 Tax=Aphanomyces euteiches TaxID=100861 RepID=A0A6G0XB11_9STRA|nr:hypothetical protein Ae201684_006472 [Aphanomyces euteiches]KAH9091220.1 hypothetical protein Ae201684P_006620 [Aphanomyces euteiches]KAH9133508.1 hypothetical protein AeRB84_020411 [Aphanomyces euteiches]